MSIENELKLLNHLPPLGLSFAHLVASAQQQPSAARHIALQLTFHGARLLLCVPLFCLANSQFVIFEIFVQIGRIVVRDTWPNRQCAVAAAQCLSAAIRA